MPSQKTRINLTLDDEVNQLFSELSQLTGTPKATFIRNIIEEMYPVLKDMRDGLVQAQQSRNSLPIALTKMASKVNEKAAYVNNEMAELLQQDWTIGND